MTDIPEDVMRSAHLANAALSVMSDGESRSRIIAETIMAWVADERERCAKVADESRARSLREESKGVHALFDYRFAASKAGEIATSIRNPEGYLNGAA